MDYWCSQNINQYIKNTVGFQGLSVKMHSLKLQCVSLHNLFVISNGVQCARKGACIYVHGWQAGLRVHSPSWNVTDDVKDVFSVTV